MFTSFTFTENVERFPIGVKIIGDLRPVVGQHFLVQMVHVSRVPYARPLAYLVYEFFREIDHIKIVRPVVISVEVSYGQ